MLIHTLQLRDFRNIHHIDTDFSEGINVIYGLNAQGKTNLLEAIYLLVTGRSFRTSNESELTPWNRADYQGTMIRATVSKRVGQEQIAFYLNGRNKRITIDGKPIDRLVHLIGRLNAVLFTPTDLLLVRGAPALRRRFLDIAIGQTNPTYLNALQTYQYILKCRNALLRKLAGNPIDHQLDIYDHQLSEAGSQIMEIRRHAIAEMTVVASRHYTTIANRDEPLALNYEPDISLAESSNHVSSILKSLQQSRSEDLKRLNTSHGPHRDDFQFQIQNYPARHFASQGQQRTAVLAVKLAEMEYLQAHTGETPLLMLDDLMSELDENRKAALLSHLNPEIQTFITTTDPQSVTRYTPAQKQIKITNGALS